MAFLSTLSVPSVHLTSSMTTILKFVAHESSCIILEKRCLIKVCFWEGFGFEILNYFSFHFKMLHFLSLPLFASSQNMLLISHGSLNDTYSTYMDEGFLLVDALGFKEMNISDLKREILQNLSSPLWRFYLLNRKSHRVRDRKGSFFFLFDYKLKGFFRWFLLSICGHLSS